MKTTALATLLAALSLTAACEGSEVRRPVGYDADTSALDADTGGDGDVSPAPRLAYWFVGETGAFGRGVQNIDLLPSDEPAAYRAFEGFQIDIAVETEGVAEGAEVRLEIGDTEIAVGTIALGEGELGQTTFASVTVPEALPSADATLIHVRAVGVDGEPLVDSKFVRLSPGECALDVALSETEGGCVAVGDGNVVATVTRRAGICTRVSGTLDFGGTQVALAEAVFVDGVATFEVPVPEGTEAADVTLAVEARGPDSDEVLASDSASGRLDLEAPAVAFVAPAEGMAVSLLDDANPDVEGLQYEVRVDVQVGDSESAFVSLSIDGQRYGVVQTTGPGPMSFGEITLEQNGLVVFSVTVVDACGNEVKQDLELLVLSTPGQLVVTSPLDGSTLLAAQDEDTETPLAYDTTFRVLAPEAGIGSALTIECQPAGSPDASWTAVGSRTLVEGDLTASAQYDVLVTVDVAALGAEVRCRAVVDTPTTATSPSIALTLGIPSGTVTVESPVNGACIGSDIVTINGSSSGAVGAELDLVTTAPSVAEPVSAGLATVAADGTWSGTAAVGDDGPYRFEVTGLDGFGNPMTSGPFDVIVDRLAPAFVIESPAADVDGLVTPDEDETAAGYQTTVTLAVDEPTSLSGGEVCLGVNDAEARCLPLAATVSFEGVTLVEGDNLLVVTGRDGCGNEAEGIDRVVRLDFVNRVLVTAPEAGAILLAKDDGQKATSTTYETTFAVDADFSTVGAAVIIGCRSASGGAYVEVGRLLISDVTADSTYDVPVVLDVTLLGTGIACQASIDAPLGTSEAIALTVALPAPSLVINTPAGASCVNGDFNLQGTGTGLDGRTVTAALRSANGVVRASTSTTMTAGSWNATLALGTTPDGAYLLSGAATDALGNDIADHNPPIVAIEVDRTKPVIAYQVPTGTVDAAFDVSPDTPGVQVDVIATLADDRATGGELCLARSGSELGCLPVLAANTPVVFEAVTLVAGVNAFTISGTDACGNAGPDATGSVELSADQPTVTITTPAADLLTAATALTFAVAVAEPDGTTPVAGATVRLFAGASDTGVTATDNGDGTYTFANVTLPLGAETSFTARATRQGATGTSEARNITQKNVTPSIAITNPPDGAAFNLASASCAAGQLACVRDVTATTTDAEDGSEALLEVDCGSTAVSVPATVNGNVVTFAAVSLTHGGTCTLTPRVTDIVGQEATGDNVSVSVDRQAPAVAITAPGLTLLTPNDRDTATPGVQAVLTATLDGVRAGTTVTAVLTWTASQLPQTRTLTHTVTTDTAEGGTYTANFTEPGLTYLTWPDGIVTIEVTVADAAGNEGSGTHVVTVDSQATIRITSPLASADTCGTGCAAGTTCNDGQCWRTWGTSDARLLTAVVTNLQTVSNNVRVCSDHPALATTGAALCDSPASATGPYRQVLVTNAISGTTILNVGTLAPDGFQRLVVEALPLAGGSWISTTSATASTERQRRVYVDLTAPVISDVSSPSDTLPPVGTLNIAEQKSTPRVYTFSFTSSEAGQAEVFVNGVSAGSRAVASGVSSFDVTLPEGTPQVWAVVTDLVNNRSPLSPGAGAAFYQPTVDVTAPTLTLTRPNKSPLRSGDNLDVVVTSDAEGRTVSILDAGTTVASSAISAGSATFADASFDILTEGSHTLTASISDAAGNSTVAATTPATVLVDTVAPVGTIISPIPGSTLDDTGDADIATPGFQVRVRFSTTGSATAWALSSADGCDASFNNCGAPVAETSGATTNPGGNEPDALVTLDLTVADSRKKLILETSDAAGNVHTTEVGIRVLVLNCTIAFVDTPTSGWYNALSCAGGASSCASASVSVDITFVGLCAADRLRLFNGATQLGEILNPDATETFTFTANHGTTLSLEGRALQGASQVASTGVEPIGVDLQPPDVSFTATNVLGFTTAAEGTTATYNAALDLNTNTAGMQLHAAVRVADTNANGGEITGIAATTNGVTTALVPDNGPLPIALTGASPITGQLLNLTLADNATHTVRVTASDAAGNTDTGTFTAVVDVTRPSAIAITQLTVQIRRPRLLPIGWNAVGDDGNAGGRAAAYDVRYSTAPIDTEAAWDAACKGFGDLAGSNPAPAPLDPGSAMVTAVGAPDPRPFSDPCKLPIKVEDNASSSSTAVYFAVRARDEVNNWSPLGPSSVRAVTNAEMWLRVGRVRFDNSNGSFGAGFNVSFLTFRGAIIGDINGDGRQDWAVGSTNANAFCVVLGQASPALDQTLTDPEGPNHTCLLASEVASISGLPAIVNGTTGNHIEPLGDVNGDGVADFGVSGKIVNGATGGAPTPSNGYVLVYFGRSGQLPNLTAPNIKIFGIRAQSGGVFFTGFCGAGDFDGLTTNSRLTADIAIGEPFANLVHVIPGNGTWTTATNLDINLGLTGNITGAWSVGGTFTNGSAALFGSRCSSAGDVLATPAGLGAGTKSDLLVLQSGSADSRVFLFPGREWSGSTAETITENLGGAPTAEDARSLRLRQESDQVRAGFGVNLQGNVDLTSDGIPDVLISNGARSPEVVTGGVAGDGKSVYVFNGARFATLLGTDVRVTVSGNPVNESWTGTNGWVLKASVGSNNRAARAIGDFNAWSTGNPSRPSIDLVIADNASRDVEIRTNHLRSALNIVHGQFPVVDGTFFNIYNDVANAVGTWLEGGFDLTGDGLLDILSGSAIGEVLIIR
jgi:hypothetical protein